jgi:hypothetical protein
MRRLRRLGFATYDDYLGSELWVANQQRWFLDHSGEHECYLCDGRAKLQLHHCNYARAGAECKEDLVLLCSGCHLKVHRFVDAGECDLEDAHVYLRRLQDAGITRNHPTSVIRATYRGRRNRRGA